MAQSEATVAAIEEWRRKTSDLSKQHDDSIITAASKGFEALGAVLAQNSDSVSIERALLYLNLERTFSLKHDKAKDDYVRNLVYGLLEIIHLTLNDLTEERKQIKDTVETFTQTGQDLALDFMHDFSGFKEEEMNDSLVPNFTRAILPEEKSMTFNLDIVGEEIKREEMLDDDCVVVEEIVDLTLSEGMSLNAPNDHEVSGIAQSEISDRGDRLSLENDRTENEGEKVEINIQPMNTPKVSENFENKEEKQSLRRVSKRVNSNDSMDDSNGGLEPQMKKSKSTSDRRSTNKRTSNVSWESNRVAKENKTELGCPHNDCDYATKSVHAWYQHLRGVHNSKGSLSGVVLRCDCGQECVSDDHAHKCQVANFTVISKKSKKDDPIRSLKVGKTTPRCILCEIHPKSVSSYISHLLVKHKSYLREAGIYLRCCCNVEARSAHFHRAHSKECDGRQFTLHKLDEN